MKMMDFEQLRRNKSMDEMKVGMFGDEQSTLVDEFERLSFEMQLNQAILGGRSLSESEPTVPKLRGGSGFNRVLKILLKPIFLTRKVNAGKNPISWKPFSRSIPSLLNVVYPYCYLLFFFGNANCQTILHMFSPYSPSFPACRSRC